MYEGKTFTPLASVCSGKASNARNIDTQTTFHGLPCHMNSRFATLLALGLGATLRLCAQDAPESDPELPQAFDPAALAPLVGHSPFNRVVNFADTYLLTGVAYVDGKPMATLLNKETKQRYVVTEQANAQGWRLAQATPTSDPKFAGVKIVVGEEEVALTYMAAAIPTDKKAKAGWTGKHRDVEPVDIHNLPESEIIRKDKDGKPYIRGSIYLPTEDRDRYYNSISREAHEKFLQVIQDNRERMMNYTPDQRQAFAKKVFDKIADDKK